TRARHIRGYEWHTLALSYFLPLLFNRLNEAGPELSLENLAHRVLRRCLHHIPVTRHFVIGKMARAQGLQAFRVDLCTGTGHHAGRNIFTQAGVGDRHDRRFLHRRVAVDDFFDGRRSDLQPAAVDDILLAIETVQMPFFVQAANVAGHDPAIHEGLGGRLGVAEVTLG